MGKAEHYVAVPAGRDPEPVQTFGSSRRTCIACAMPEGARRRNRRQAGNGCLLDPPFQILESYGFQINVVNARHTNTLPGRETNVLECMATEAAHLRTVEQIVSSDGGNPGIANLLARRVAVRAGTEFGALRPLLSQDCSMRSTNRAASERDDLEAEDSTNVRSHRLSVSQAGAAFQPRRPPAEHYRSQLDEDSGPASGRPCRP